MVFVLQCLVTSLLIISPCMPFTHAVHRRKRSFWHLGSVLKLMPLYIGCHFNFSEAGCVANEAKDSYKGGIPL